MKNKDVLFKDWPDVLIITDKVVALNKGQIAGNARINMGIVYTSEAKEKYTKESLERELP